MNTVHKLEKLLLGFDEVEFAYLFGSYAKGTQDNRSDIDIAIFIKDGFNIFDTKLSVHHKLEITMLKDIDIISLNNVKNFNLLEDILNIGIIIKESVDDSRIMFELRKEHEILDYKAFQKMLNVA